MNLTSYKYRFVLFIWIFISFLCLVAKSSEKDNAKGVDTMKDMKKIQQLLKGDKPLIWLFTGDSITHGCCIPTAGEVFLNIFQSVFVGS